MAKSSFCSDGIASLNVFASSNLVSTWCDVVVGPNLLLLIELLVLQIRDMGRWASFPRNELVEARAKSRAFQGIIRRRIRI